MSTELIESKGKESIDFEEVGGSYISDTFTAEGTSIAICLTLDKAGSCTLYKGLYNKGLVPAVALTRWGDTAKRVVRNVSGLVPGQFLQIVFNKGAKPLAIDVLHGPAGGSGDSIEVITDAEIDEAWNL